MKHNISSLLVLSAMASASVAMAQNPFIKGQYTADPTARVFGDRIYVYPSHDILAPEGVRQDWFCMADYHVFSSDNLVDWTDHGVILDQKDVPWGNPTAYSMWAPDCVQGKDGRYYFFFPNAPKEGRGFGVGVAISDTPYGPFKAEPNKIEGISGIDPCVLQASDGNNYIFWGGGGLRAAKLKDNLLELSDDNEKSVVKFGDREMTMIGVDVAKNLPEGFKEGPFAFEHNGKYYLTYPWVRGKAGDPGPDGKPLDNHTETLAYAMSDNPLGPYEYKGLIMKESPTYCWTNHHSIVQFQGEWYLFYHHNDYSPKFDKNRSVRIDKLTFNADGTINEVIPTLRGVGVTRGEGKIELDRYSEISGKGASIDYLDTLNYFAGWYTELSKGGWVKYNQVELTNATTKVWMRVKASQKGTLKLSLHGKTSQTLTLSVPATKGWQTLSCPVSGIEAGMYDLQLLNSGALLQVDWISLTEDVATTFAQTVLPYQNPRLSPKERAKDLCARLTIEEKAQLMLDISEAVPRLGIKTFNWWSEALHGVANQGNVTVYPEPIGMAASFNDDLVYEVFDQTSDEARAAYNEWIGSGKEDTRFHSLSFWTPNVNIFRDPRWGRGQETYGEDPYLTSRMGVQVVKGLQGPADTQYRKLYACAKHYAIHSGPEWGRHVDNVTNVSPRDLWETYMPAFKACVQKGDVREVMCAYQRWDDEPCCGSQRLLQKILRDDWGFQYMVVSDCSAVSDFWQTHKSSSSATTSAAKAALAGTDVECGYDYAYKSLPKAVAEGLIDMKDVDIHICRLLEGRFELGEMDDPSLVQWSQLGPEILNSRQHQQTALEMARQTLVLLQNRNNTLPLKKGKVAVIGPNANDEQLMWGNYNGTPNQTETLLEGIQQMVGKGNVVSFKGCDLVSNKVLESFYDQCSIDGRKGFRGTFWKNDIWTMGDGHTMNPATLQGKNLPAADAVRQHEQPVNVTTYGNYAFAPGIPLTKFSGLYESVFRPKQSCKVLLDVEGCSYFEVFVNGKSTARQATWRDTDTRTEFEAKAGEEYKIEIRYAQILSYNANLKVNIGRENDVDYDALISQLNGIETVVFAGGISARLEGEEMPISLPGFKGGDRTDIELPSVQRGFLQALHKAGKKVVFVNFSGSAMALVPETESCDAILQAWYPGERGGQAIAEVLYGKCNPGGKLPVTFYKSLAQLPDYHDYSMKGRTYRYMTQEPLFPFGFGLSYSKVHVGLAKASGEVFEGEPITLSIPVSYSGHRLDGLDLCKLPATEVVQLYVRRMGDSEGPVKTLRGYQRLTLQPGDVQYATLTVDAETLETFDPSTNTMRVLPGRYELLYGTSSADKDLKCIEIEVR